MKYKVEFQFKPKSDKRPVDAVQESPRIEFEVGQFIPIPDVGDTVNVDFGDGLNFYKVETRHFSYVSDLCVVTIVVTGVATDEMAARLKE